MLRSIIKYGGLALVVIGIILVMKNLFKSDSSWNNDKKNKGTTIVSSNEYNATISLLDEETKEHLTGAKLIIKDTEGNVISEWTTEASDHLVPNLKNGTYTIVEEVVPANYKLNEENITFKIKNKDKKVKIYNTKMTEEEIEAYEAEQREKNTVANEIGVENTLSTGDVTVTILAIISIILGVDLIFFQKETNQ